MQQPAVWCTSRHGHLRDTAGLGGASAAGANRAQHDVVRARAAEDLATVPRQLMSAPSPIPTTALA